MAKSSGFMNITTCYNNFTNYMPEDNPEMKGHDGPLNNRSPFTADHTPIDPTLRAPHEAFPLSGRSLVDKIFRNLLGFWPKP